MTHRIALQSLSEKRNTLTLTCARGPLFVRPIAARVVHVNALIKFPVYSHKHVWARCSCYSYRVSRTKERNEQLTTDRFWFAWHSSHVNCAVFHRFRAFTAFDCIYRSRWFDQTCALRTHSFLIIGLSSSSWSKISPRATSASYPRNQ